MRFLVAGFVLLIAVNSSAVEWKMPAPSLFVHVLGAVKRPGSYEMPMVQRLNEAIRMAGDFIDTKNMLAVIRSRGSTGVYQKTEYESEAVYDLHKYRYQGDITQSPLLNDGDVIFVPSGANE